MNGLPPPPSLRSLFLLPLLAAALVLAGCGGGSSGSESDADVPYQVGEALTDSTLALVVSSDYGTDTLRARQYQRQTKMTTQRLSPEERTADTLQAIHRDLIRRFVGGHVLRGKAQADDIEVDQAQVSARLEKIKQKYQGEEQLKQQLARNNMTMDSLRSTIASQLQAQTLRQQLADRAEAPSEAEIEEYSQENRRIRAQHILLRAGENAADSKVDSARQAASALIDSAEGGADFAELARRHSEGPSASEGGDLGFFTEDQMVEPFSEAAFALSDSGDVAPEPVRTRFGFHVIRLTNAGEPMDTSKARQQMMQERRKDTFDAELEKLMEGVTVQAHPSVVKAGFYEDNE